MADTAMPADTAADLRGRVVRGFTWSLSTVVTTQVSRLVFGVVLARLLTPREYGLAGMALVFAALVLVFSDVALGAGLVQRAKITERDRSTVFWTSAAVGLLLTVCGVALSGPIAAFYGEPDVQPLLAVLSLGFFVTALGRTHAALFHREMAFRAIAVRVAAASVAGGSVGVGLAATGYGPWALIGQQIAVAVVTTALLWVVSGWRPRLTFSLASLRDLGGFGLKVLGTKVVEYLNANGDKVLVGRFLGSSSLGLYAVAYNLVLLPFTSLITAVNDTLFPALSRLQDDSRRLGATWIRATRAVTAVAAPAVLGLVVVAPDLIPVLLGERWRPAVPVVQILAFGGLVHSVASLGGTVLTAVDRTRLLLRFSLLELAVVFTALGVGLRWGLIGLAAAYTAGTVVTRLSLIWLTARTLGVRVGSLVGSLSGIVQAAVAMAGALWLLTEGLAEAGAPGGARVGAAVVVGVLVYVPLCSWRAPEVLTEVRAARVARASA